MQAIYLIKNGAAETAFEMRESDLPQPAAGELLIKVEAFGLNFADVMARLGLYRDAPPLPSVMGYDVVGHIEATGSDVKGMQIGQRVTALTRFGGYAQYAIADARAVAPIPENMKAGVAVALSTQYCTAYMLAEEMIGLHAGDLVLIHAAAGGVGTALVQLARHHGCVIFGTAGSPEKLDYLRKLGVQYPINYRKEDFSQAIRAVIDHRGLDAIFDPIGGKSVKKGVRLLAPGGRIACFGGSSMTQAHNIIQKVGIALGFGLYSPIQLLSGSKGIIGINMLRIADHRPDRIQRVMKRVVEMTESNILNPTIGGEFQAHQIAEAHTFLESRKSMGKVVVTW